MDAAWPNRLLLVDGFESARHGGGTWRFVLHHTDGGEVLAASDYEPDASPERLELLALVRGLEAINEPSRVTVLTDSPRLRWGLTRGLGAWRANRWRYERFGRVVPVRDADLWRRVDHALRFHKVRCRTLRSGETTGAPVGVDHVYAGPEAPVLRATHRTEQGAEVPSPAFSEPAVLVVRSSQRGARTWRPAVAAAG